MQSKVKENAMVSPYILFFLVVSSQTGVGLLNYQSNIIKGAGRDAWVSILLIGLSLHLIFFMMLYIIKQSSNGDIISFHTDLFGKVLGGLLNLFLSLYFFLSALSVLHSYIDILQIWVFDGIPGWEFSLILCVVFYYVISGGFRNLAGTAFWGIIIPSALLLSLLYILNYAKVSYILPFFNHSVMEYIISAKEGLYMFFGLGNVLVYYPFIKNGMEHKRWGHLGILATTLLYVLVTVITFMFFTQGKLQHLAWPTLTMIKVITFPFLERFEFIFIFTWLLVVAPVICINLWSTTRIVKLTFPKWKATRILFVLLSAVFLYNSSFRDIYFTKILNTITTNTGLIFLYVYIPLLFLISMIRSRFKRKKPKQQENKPAGTEI